MADEPMWCRFLEHHDHQVDAAGNQTVAYKKGMRAALTRAAFEIAKALGRAEAIPAPNQATAAALKLNPYAADVAQPAPPPAPSPPPPEKTA
jgi:hypothetical protein